MGSEDINVLPYVVNGKVSLNPLTYADGLRGRSKCRSLRRKGLGLNPLTYADGFRAHVLIIMSI